MRKILFAMMVVLLLNVSLVLAHEHNFAETKQLIDSGISCDKLTDEQLESIGDYYMEQMHPGEAHEMMDNMMGGEGSESLRLMHITMAKRLYCNDISDAVNYGMMGYGMMGGMTGYGFGYWNFVNILYVILLVGLIVLVYLCIVKLWKNMQKKGNKK